MEPTNQDHPFRQQGEELPDYSEEEVRPPGDRWFKDPRKRGAVLRLLLALVVVLAFLPLYRGLKEWRASSLDGEVRRGIRGRDSERGVSLLKQALALAPGSPRIQHAVELYNARAGDPASLEKLVARMKSGDSDDRELLGIAEIAAMKERGDLARRPWRCFPQVGKREFLRRSLLEASLKAREGSPLESADFCIRRAGRLSPGGCRVPPDPGCA